MMKNSFGALAILALSMCGSNLVMGGIDPSKPVLSKEEATDQLFQAFFKANPEHAKELVDAGADVNGRHNYGMTPLHLAAQRGYRNLTIKLINADADINAKTDTDNTPLHLAAISGQVDLMCELVRRGADLHIKNKDGRTALEYIQIESFKKQIVDARHEFERKQRELRERLTTLAASLQHNECPRDVIGEVLEKSATLWGIKKTAEVSGKDESSSAPSSLSSFAGHSKATADREE